MTTTTDQAKGRTWKDPGEPPTVPQRPAVDEIVVEVELVTPMLGGGVDPRKHDPNGWLRPASVKGQLRFWWRALHAQSYATKEELREAEGKLFGLPATFDKNGDVLGGPGIVSIAVSSASAVVTKKYPESLRDIAERYGATAYFLFPAQRAGTEPSADLVWPGARATLRATFTKRTTPQQRADVERALAAWLTLGGIGSRTRRAIGAVALVGAAPTGLIVPSHRDGLVDYLRTIGCSTSNGSALPVFSFAGRVHAIRVGQCKTSAGDAVESLAEAWKAARQERATPQNGARFGRSKWPEPDTVRRSKKKWARWSDGTEHNPQLPDGAPRARLGLPIGLKFIDADPPSPKDPAGQTKLGARGGAMVSFDPGSVEIKHEDGDRFASPVLLCVVKVTGGFVPVVIATRPTLPYKATLDGKTIEAGMTDEAILDRVLAPFAKNGFDKVFPR